jgi:zinc protease
MLRTAMILSAVLGLSVRAASAADPLPTADTVLDQYIEATGGKAAYEKLKNRVAKGTIEVTGAGLKGTITLKEAAPGQRFVEVDIEGVGKSTEGTDGTVAWTVSTLTGDRVLDGEEKNHAILEAIFNGELNWKKKYEKVECTGIEVVEGKPAYKIVLTPKEGKPVVHFYDKNSHLIVKAVVTQKSPMGEITAESIPSDYKKVDGILISHSAKQKVLTQEIVMKITEIKHNVDLPADTFKTPAAIQELIEKAKKKD